MNIHAQPGLEPTPWREEMAAARRPPVDDVGGEWGRVGEGGRTECAADGRGGEEDCDVCAEFGAFVPATKQKKKIKCSC